MNAPLPKEKIDQLVPILNPLVEFVKEFGTLNSLEIQLLLLGIGITEEWAVLEVGLWVKILSKVQNLKDQKKTLAQVALVKRGIPVEMARIAIQLITRKEAVSARPSLYHEYPLLNLRGDFYAEGDGHRDSHKIFGNGDVFRIAVFGTSKMLMILASGAQLYSFEQCRVIWKIHCICDNGEWSSGGDRLLLWKGKAITVWDLTTGQMCLRREVGEKISFARFGKGSDQVVIFCESACYVWDINDEDDLAEIHAPPDEEFVDFAVDPAFSRMAIQIRLRGRNLSGGCQSKLRFYSMGDLENCWSIADASTWDIHDAWDYAITGEGNVIQVWSIDTQEVLWERTLEKEISRLKFCPNGRDFLAASGEFLNKFEIFSSQSKGEIKFLEIEDWEYVSTGKISVSGDGALIGLRCGVIDECNETTAPCGVVLTDQLRVIEMLKTSDFTFGTDKRTVGLINSNKRISLYDMQKRKTIAEFDQTSRPIDSVCFHPEEPCLLVGGGRFWVRGQQIDFYDLKTDRMRGQISNGNHMVKMSRGGQFIYGKRVEGYEEGRHEQMYVWGFKDRNLVWNGAAGRISFRRDEEFFAVVLSDEPWIEPGNKHYAAIINSRTGKEFRRFAHPATVTQIGFSQDGKTFLSLCSDNTLRYWDLFAGSRIFEYKGIPDAYNACFSSSGRYLATNDAGNVIIWDVEKRKQWKSIHVGTKGSVFFSHDEKRLAMVGKVIDIEPGVVYDFYGNNIKSSRTIDATFSWDDRYLIFYLDPGISVIDLENYQHVENEYIENATYVDFSPDGKTFATGEKNGLVHVYERDVLER